MGKTISNKPSTLLNYEFFIDCFFFTINDFTNTLNVLNSITLYSVGTHVTEGIARIDKRIRNINTFTHS